MFQNAWQSKKRQTMMVKGVWLGAGKIFSANGLMPLAVS